MTDYVVKDIDLADFGRAPDADGGYSLERTDLIDALLYLSPLCILKRAGF